MIPAAVLAAAIGLSRAPDQAAVDAIESAARAAHVPVSLALAVCALESGIGTRGAILCGCGSDRDTIAQARCAAGTLAYGRRACGSWAASLRRYRYGLGRASEHGCPLADPRNYVGRVSAYQGAVALATRAQVLGL